MKPQKMKLLFLLALILCVAGLATACNDIINLDDYTKKGDNLQEENSLVGTKWKLTAFVDVENNTRREPDYYPDTYESVKDSMYILSFDNDSLASGKSIANRLRANYSVNYDINNLFFTILYVTEVCEPIDGHLFLFTLGVESFSFKLYPQALHLFYNDGKEYLEFKRIGG